MTPFIETVHEIWEELIISIWLCTPFKWRNPEDFVASLHCGGTMKTTETVRW